jgi:hypothetical protein
MKNRKLVLTVVSMVAVAALVLAGGVMASNMGFKLNLPLLAASGGVSASGTNYVALPYNAQVGLVTAKDLFLDIPGAQQINRHVKSNDGFDFYSVAGTNLPPNGWNLAAGEAYIVKMGANLNYIVVGSHNPGLSVSLVGPGPGSGTNYYAHPYHGVAANAKDLFFEIGGPIQQLNRHVKLNDSFDFYSIAGTNLPPNGWDLKPGEGYIVKVGANHSFVPAHY